MKKIILSILVFVFINTKIDAQTTAIPDPAFESRLVNLGYDTVIDGTVPTANIDTITNLDVSVAIISDLTGIQDFTALASLDCSANLILTSLDVTQNIALTYLDCSGNSLTSLDVTQNTGLTSLSCDGNVLASLDVTQNTTLTTLSCSGNVLTNLDVTQNTGLTFLNCCGNLLTSLDVTQNTGLTFLICCSNSLASLDVTQNTALTSLNCTNNLLTALDVRNGNNANFTTFNASSNTSLNCIYVDDKNASYLSGWIKDASTFWANDSLDCQSLVSIDEYSLEESLSIYPNPSNGIFTINSKNLKSAIANIYTISGQLILQQSLIHNATKIDLTKYPKGMYILQVKSNKKYLVNKIIKQ